MIINAAELKRRYLKRIAGIRDKTVYIGPEIVTLNVNLSCNLTCRFCGPQKPASWGAQPQPADYYQWEKFLRVVKDCIELKVDTIQFLGGEPTTHPLFRNLLRHLEDKPLKVKVYTNATFPAEYCTDVIRADHVVVNLSAADRETYFKLTGSDLFDQAVDNIKRLVLLRDSVKPDFCIEIVCVVNTINKDQQSRISDLAGRLGVHSVLFRRMQVSDYNRAIAFPEDDREQRSPPVCLSGWFNMVLMPDGKVSACGEVLKMPIGDFNKLDLKELWASERMMNIRLLGKHGKIQKMYDVCQSCPYYSENMAWMQDAAGLERNNRVSV